MTLRQQNKLLVTKCAALQRQLQAAHAASRSAQQVNAQWRSEHRSTREREREHYAQLQAALEKAERSERLQVQNARLRSQLRERDQQLVSSGRRIAELEQLVVSLRTVLRQSVRGIAMAGLEPDPPLLQGPAVNLA